MKIDFLESPNQSNRTPGTKITGILIHATASANFDGARDWMLRPISKVSSHYLIGKDGEIVQLVKDEKRAFHAGLGKWDGTDDVNSMFIGIELVNRNNNQDPYPEKQIDKLVELTVFLMSKHPELKLRNIVGHHQTAPQRKTDPGLLFPWFEYGFKVAQALAKIKP